MWEIFVRAQNILCDLYVYFVKWANEIRAWKFVPQQLFLKKFATQLL